VRGVALQQKGILLLESTLQFTLYNTFFSTCSQLLTGTDIFGNYIEEIIIGVEVSEEGLLCSTQSNIDVDNRGLKVNSSFHTSSHGSDSLSYRDSLTILAMDGEIDDGSLDFDITFWATIETSYGIFDVPSDKIFTSNLSGIAYDDDDAGITFSTLDCEYGEDVSELGRECDLQIVLDIEVTSEVNIELGFNDSSEHFLPNEQHDQ